MDGYQRFHDKMVERVLLCRQIDLILFLHFPPIHIQNTILCDINSGDNVVLHRVVQLVSLLVLHLDRCPLFDGCSLRLVFRRDVVLVHCPVQIMVAVKTYDEFHLLMLHLDVS